MPDVKASTKYDNLTSTSYQEIKVQEHTPSFPVAFLELGKKSHYCEVALKQPVRAEYIMLSIHRKFNSRLYQNFSVRPKVTLMLNLQALLVCLVTNLRFLKMCCLW